MREMTAVTRGPCAEHPRVLAGINTLNVLCRTCEGPTVIVILLVIIDFTEKDKTCLESATKYPCNGSKARTKEALIE